jgi:hypothetical protein
VPYELTEEDGALVLATRPGVHRAEIPGTDLIADPQSVKLETGQTRTLRFAVAIGRTRRLVFNGDGEHRPERGTALHVVVRSDDGAVVAKEDLLQLMPDLRGFRYWYLNRVYPFGRYTVEAHTDAGWRYRDTFDVRENLDDPTQVDVPLVR